MPLILATIVTLVLGGASVARAVTVPALDAHTDLEFSLDGSTWTDAPDVALGSWGCDLSAGPATSDPAEETGGIPGVDPCAMLPGEFVDRAYYVRNATDSGRTGRYEVGVGDFAVSDGAEFAVRSTITSVAGSGAGSGSESHADSDSGSYSDSGTVMLYGAGTGQDGDSPDRGATVAALALAPGQSAHVVDEVSVPRDVPNTAQRQSVSPRMWVSFSDVSGIDRDGDGLPDTIEEQLGTDPSDPLNSLPSATAGREYGPEPFLPAPPQGTVLDVDADTLPSGMALEDGALTGTPTRAGTYDIGFKVTMPGGATYTSIRRVVVGPASDGGGSSDLPDVVWPVLVGGVIGVIGVISVAIGSVGPGLGSLAGWGSSSGAPAMSPPSSTSAAPDPRQSEPGQSEPGESDPARPHPGSPGDATTTRVVRPATADGTGRVAEITLTPRGGAPSDEWVRANSEVRGPLATTGVSGAELVLWALTAAAAGATLILFARRRHHDGPAHDSDPGLDGEA